MVENSMENNELEAVDCTGEGMVCRLVLRRALVDVSAYCPPPRERGHVG